MSASLATDASFVLLTACSLTRSATCYLCWPSLSFIQPVTWSTTSPHSKPMSTAAPTNLFLQNKQLGHFCHWLFLFSKSQRCFGLSNQISRCTFQWGKVEFTRLAHSLGQMYLLFQQDPICLGPNMRVSCMQICILLDPIQSLVVRSGHGPQAEVAQGVGPGPLVEL